MRVALAQIDVTVGDIEGNLVKCLESVAAAQALEVGITLLPELALTGYPPEDLVHKDHFVEDNRDALERLAAACTDPVIVGFVDSDENGVYNAAALLGAHGVMQVYRKRRLPNYGVFDERRYFEPGTAPGVADVGGTRIAMTVCEDIWTPDLAAEARAQRATVLFNISASPFHVGKGASREEMLVRRATDNGVWVVYCNLVGGQDELVFDGRSVIVSPQGEVVARGAAFSEDLVVADIGPDASEGSSTDLAPIVSGPEEVYRAICVALRDYVHKNGFTDVVLGLSGGIDSALVAAIASDALGPEHVHGVLMPSRYSSQGSTDDALALAQALGIETRTIGIEGPHAAFLEALAPSFQGLAQGIAEENVQARVRGTLVMALSNKFNWLALATGNKSELSVGYSTLYGDMVGGFAPLRDVYKTRVYELARWRNGQPGGPVIPEATILKPPSAELRPGQVDQDSLPPYEELDQVLIRYVERDMSRDDIVREGHPSEMVDKVVGMTDRAEYKRRQGPIGVKITPKSFGKDRRMPITNRYQG